MKLEDALAKSKIAMLNMADKMVLVTNTAAYEAEVNRVAGACFIKDFKVVKNFNNIPLSDEWKPLGYALSDEWKALGYER